MKQIYFFLLLLLIPLIIAELQVGNVGEEGVNFVYTSPTNYSSVNTNHSATSDYATTSGSADLWDALDTPADISHPLLANLLWSVAGHTIDTNFLPLLTLTYDIGSGALRWRKLWVQNISAENINTFTLDVRDNITGDWFNGRFNWTSADNWNIFDGSTLTFNETKLSPVFYNASTVVAIRGTTQGTLANIQSYDSVSYNVTEVSGANGLDFRVNFTGITKFNQIKVRYKSSASESHIMYLQIYDSVLSNWENYYVFGSVPDYMNLAFDVDDEADHIIGGVVQVRFYQADNGNTNHMHQFDWVVISEGFGTPSSQEIDPYSWHRDQNGETGNFTTLGWVQAGNLNITGRSYLGTMNLVGGNITGNIGNFSVLIDTGLTSGRMTYASTGGQLADSSKLTYSTTTNTLTMNTGQLAVTGTAGGDSANAVAVCTMTGGVGGDSMAGTAGTGGGFSQTAGAGGTGGGGTGGGGSLMTLGGGLGGTVSSGGAGGPVTISAGKGISPYGGNGGALTINAGNSSGGTGGALSIFSGSGPLSMGGNGGAITIQTGEGTTTAGAITIKTGAGSKTNDISLVCSDIPGSTGMGKISLQSGKGGSPGMFVYGNIYLGNSGGYVSIGNSSPVGPGDGDLWVQDDLYVNDTITHSTVWDTSKFGSPLNYSYNPASVISTGNTYNHELDLEPFKAYRNVTDFDNCWNVTANQKLENGTIINIQVTKCGTKIVLAGSSESMKMWFALSKIYDLEQKITSQQSEINLLKSELCRKDPTYVWCLPKP